MLLRFQSLANVHAYHTSVAFVASLWYVSAAFIKCSTTFAIIPETSEWANTSQSPDSHSQSEKHIASSLLEFRGNALTLPPLAVTTAPIASWRETSGSAPRSENHPNLLIGIKLQGKLQCVCRLRCWRLDSRNNLRSGRQRQDHWPVTTGQPLGKELARLHRQRCAVRAQPNAGKINPLRRSALLT